MSGYTQQELDHVIDEAANRASESTAARIDKTVEKAVDGATKKAATKIDAAIERASEGAAARIDEAAERAAGAVYEKFKHDIDLVLESTGFIRQRLESMVTRDEFRELKSETNTIRHVVTATNKDLKVLSKRVDRLEKTGPYA